MNKKYPAGSLTFTRPGSAEDEARFMNASTAWDNVLSGKSLQKFRNRFITPGLAAVSEAWAKAEGKVFKPVKVKHVDD